MEVDQSSTLASTDKVKGPEIIMPVVTQVSLDKDQAYDALKLLGDPKRINSQNFDDKPVITKSKRGRKALAVSEGHIDTTGRTHIMTIGRSKPPTPKKKDPKAPKAIKQSNNYCRRCEQNDEYNHVLNDRIGKLESLVNKLTNATKYNNNTQKNPQTLSNIGTVELFNLSNQITPNIDTFNDRIGKLENIINKYTHTTIPQSLFYTGTEDPFEMQSQIQDLMEPPATTSTPYIGITNEPIGHLESLLNKPKLPQPYIGTEKPFEMQIQLHSQMASPSSTLTPSYEPVDFANWSIYQQYE
ncbi:2695_t:CDS:2 [Funneliformis caledonium]|uniref:2695_t:CDS:1 n=1 Tax=Funneliformis caledonium TaxID=1117310 RepID=A0A9N8YRE0_9GLOM|nr:2695_t:CDS:2 [Funneliformis caledonium]